MCYFEDLSFQRFNPQNQFISILFFTLVSIFFFLSIYIYTLQTSLTTAETESPENSSSATHKTKKKFIYLDSGDSLL